MKKDARGRNASVSRRALLRGSAAFVSAATLTKVGARAATRHAPKLTQEVSA